MESASQGHPQAIAFRLADAIKQSLLSQPHIARIRRLADNGDRYQALLLSALVALTGRRIGVITFEHIIDCMEAKREWARCIELALQMALEFGTGKCLQMLLASILSPDSTSETREDLEDFAIRVLDGQLTTSDFEMLMELQVMQPSRLPTHNATGQLSTTTTVASTKPLHKTAQSFTTPSTGARYATLNTIELLENIIKFLPHQSIFKAERVCKTWRDLIGRSKVIARARCLTPAGIGGRVRAGVATDRSRVNLPHYPASKTKIKRHPATKDLGRNSFDVMDIMDIFDVLDITDIFGDDREDVKTVSAANKDREMRLLRNKVFDPQQFITSPPIQRVRAIAWFSRSYDSTTEMLGYDLDVSTGIKMSDLLAMEDELAKYMEGDGRKWSLTINFEQLSRCLCRRCYPVPWRGCGRRPEQCKHAWLTGYYD